jgi:hypothetical protein
VVVTVRIIVDAGVYRFWHYACLSERV